MKRDNYMVEQPRYSILMKGKRSGVVLKAMLLNENCDSDTNAIELFTTVVDFIKSDYPDAVWELRDKESRLIKVTRGTQQ